MIGERRLAETHIEVMQGVTQQQHDLMICTDDGATLHLRRPQQQHAFRDLRQPELAQRGQGVLLLLIGAIRDVANGHPELVGVLKKLFRTWNQRRGTVTLPRQPGVPGVIGVTVGQITRKQGAVINNGFIQVGNDGQLDDLWLAVMPHPVSVDGCTPKPRARTSPPIAAGSAASMVNSATPQSVLGFAGVSAKVVGLPTSANARLNQMALLLFSRSLNALSSFV